MPKPNTDGGYTLPAVVDTDRLCFPVSVPNDPHHIAAFFGALYDLTQWYNWQRNEEHTALDVAAVWKSTFNDLSDQYQNGQIYPICGGLLFDIRANPLNPCEIQKTYDGGLSWNYAFTLEDCFNKLQPPWNPPDRTQPGENPNGSTPPAGDCWDYDLSLQANGYVIIPLELHEGDTVLIDHIQGATHGGNIYQDWYCGNGDLFVLGLCLPGTPVYLDNDPVVGSPHHLLILHTPDDVFVGVPEGLNLVCTAVQAGFPWTFQVNDSNLSDNSGSLNFHVRVCRGCTTGVTYVQYNHGSGDETVCLKNSVVMHSEQVGFEHVIEFVCSGANTKLTITDGDNYGFAGNDGDEWMIWRDVNMTRRSYTNHDGTDPETFPYGTTTHDLYVSTKGLGNPFTLTIYFDTEY